MTLHSHIYNIRSQTEVTSKCILNLTQLLEYICFFANQHNLKNLEIIQIFCEYSFQETHLKEQFCDHFFKHIDIIYRFLFSESVLAKYKHIN